MLLAPSAKPAKQSSLRSRWLLLLLLLAQLQGFLLCIRSTCLLLLGCCLLLLRCGGLLLCRCSGLLRGSSGSGGRLLCSSTLARCGALRSGNRSGRQSFAGTEPAHASGGLAAVEGGPWLAREGREHGAEGGALVLGGAALNVARELPLVWGSSATACRPGGATCVWGLGA